MEGFVLGVVSTLFSLFIMAACVHFKNEPDRVEFDTRCEMLGGQSLEGSCYKLPLQEIPITLKGKAKRDDVK